MKIIKNIFEFIIGTAIIWLPIVASFIAEKLAEIITMEQIMTVVYIAIPVLFGIIIKMDLQEAKYKSKKKKGVKKYAR